MIPTALRPGNTTQIILAWMLLALLETGAQLSIKIASGQPLDANFGYAWIASLLTNFWFLLSLACDAASFLLWIFLIRRHDLSFAVPVSSICYFAIIAASVLLLGETLQLLQAAGLAAVGCGIMMIASDETRNAAGA